MLSRFSYANRRLAELIERLDLIDLKGFIQQYQQGIDRVERVFSLLKHDAYHELRDAVSEKYQRLIKKQPNRMIHVLYEQMPAEEFEPINVIRKKYLAIQKALLQDNFLNDADFHENVEQYIHRLASIKKMVISKLSAEVVAQIKEKEWNEKLKENLLSFVRHCIKIHDESSLNQLLAIKSLLPLVETNQFLPAYQHALSVLHRLSNKTEERWSHSVRKLLSTPPNSAFKLR